MSAPCARSGQPAAANVERSGGQEQVPTTRMCLPYLALGSLTLHRPSPPSAITSALHLIRALRNLIIQHLVKIGPPNSFSPPTMPSTAPHLIRALNNPIVHHLAKRHPLNSFSPPTMPSTAPHLIRALCNLIVQRLLGIKRLAALVHVHRGHSVSQADVAGIWLILRVDRACHRQRCKVGRGEGRGPGEGWAALVVLVTGCARDVAGIGLVLQVSG